VDLVSYLTGNEPEIVREAAEKVERAGLRHYRAVGAEETAERLRRLFERVLVSLSRRDLTPAVDHAVALARERFDAGCDLSEVQTAINALEETFWTRIVRDFPPEELAAAIGLVGTVLGASKDALARTYVSLASRTHAPSLDLAKLFEGAEGG
jgi:hypothetical protein